MIKEWVKANLSKVEKKIFMLEGQISTLECDEEYRLLIEQEQLVKHKINLKLQGALKNEEVLWSKKARVVW